MGHREDLPGYAETNNIDPIDTDQPEIRYYTGQHIRPYIPESDTDAYLDTIISKIEESLVKHGLRPII